ncbi:MAG: hypothetical protein HC808_11835 [Candidatus Competibacteraceae bacterium]|nr:hypothetical protein [Candidatus Competibacteraceae bacterium]
MSTEKQLRKDLAADLRYQLERNQHLQRRWESEFDQASQWLLRNWQTARLRQTHADLLQNSRYRPAVEFFLHELYGDRDFSRRDHDIERAYPIIVRTMPAGALHSVVMAIELNVLSHELDADLLRVLIDEFAVKDQLNEEVYVRAYRHCDNYAQRLRQIELIGILGRDLELIVVKPLIYTALRLAKGRPIWRGSDSYSNLLKPDLTPFGIWEKPTHSWKPLPGERCKYLNAFTITTPVLWT